MGAGGENNWRFLRTLTALELVDQLATSSRFVLAAELVGMAQVQCDACDGWGHSFKHCATQKRLVEMSKGSTTAGSIMNKTAEAMRAARASQVSEMRKILQKRLKPDARVDAPWALMPVRI